MSRYSSYSSRYGDKDDDYSSLSSYSRIKPERPRTNYSSTSSRTSTYSPKSYDSSSYLTPSTKSAYSSKYESYASKYANSNKQSDKKMEDAPALVVPIAKDEIEELDYSAPQTPIEDAEPVSVEQQEVLQESQIDEFDEEPKTVEATLTLSDETPVIEELDNTEEDLVPAPQIEDKTYTSYTREPEAINIDENRTPSPVHSRNGKKVVGGWPPKSDDSEIKIGGNQNQDTDTVPKKRVSDLIARFNTGNVDGDGKKADSSYKSEYGAGTNVGKITQNQFE